MDRVRDAPTSMRSRGVIPWMEGEREKVGERLCQAEELRKACFSMGEEEERDWVCRNWRKERESVSEAGPVDISRSER